MKKKKKKGGGLLPWVQLSSISDVSKVLKLKLSIFVYFHLLNFIFKAALNLIQNARYANLEEVNYIVLANVMLQSVEYL